MIVRRDAHVLHLITQPDHAALARHVMERWVPLHDADRRASILLAVEEHDNGWREADAEPQVRPDGGVHDFVDTPVESRQAVWPRGVRRLADEDEWAAALVAQHAITVYDRYRSDAAWTAFFPRLEALRDSLLIPTRRTLTQLLHDYAFVRIGDLISLIFCNQWDEPQSYDRWSFQRSSDRVVVSPDPFGGREVSLAVKAREIAARPYASDAELRQAVRQARLVTLTGACLAG